MDGNLTLASGTLSTSGNDITVAGSWYNDGGILDAGTDTVTLDGTGSDNELQTGGSSFANLAITGTGSWDLHDALYVGENARASQPAHWIRTPPTTIPFTRAP